MSLTRCPYCEHGNPADSKFCSACGGALHLVPCPHCGAVNQVTAIACYQCRGKLPGRRTDALESSSPAAEVSPHRPSRVIIGAVVLATIAALGYYSYRQRPLAEAPQPPAASSEPSGRGGPSGAGLTGAATAPSESPPADPTRAATSQPRAGRQPVESPEAKAAVVAITRPQGVNAGRAGERGPSRPEACTEAVAALGLCTPKPVQKKEAETSAAAKAAIARPQTTDAGKAGGQEPRRAEACTEAVAALGLCTLKPTQRKE